MDTNIIIRNVLWTVVLVGVGFLTISAVKHKQKTSILNTQVNIELLEGGDNLITKEDVTAEVVEYFGEVAGKQIYDIDVKLIEEVLTTNPFIKSADVFVDANNSLNVNITQREPIMRMVNVSNEHFYMDKEGEVIPVSPHYTSRVVVASGHIPVINEEESSDLIGEMFELGSALYEDTFLRSLIDQVYLGSDDLIYLVPNIGADKIVLGEIKNVSEKLENLKIIYHEGLTYKGWQAYESIDLRFDGQVVCEKK